MKSSKFRYFLLGVSMLAFLFAGVIYAWSTIKAPFVNEFGWQGASLAFCYTLTLIFFCLGGLVSGLLSKKFSPRIRLVAAALLVFGGFAIMSGVNANGIALLYLGYGFMAGTGIGITYNTLVSVTNAWFPDKKGLCSGGLMMAFGFSALLVGLVAANGFDAIGWRKTYLFLGLATGLVLLLASFVLKMPETAPAPKKAAGKAGAEYEPKEMLRRASFYKLFAFFFLLSSVGSCAIGIARELLEGFGENAVAMTATVVGAISICNGIGRMLSGAAFDALGLRKTQYLTSAVAICAPLCVVLSLVTGSLPLAVVGLCLCGISYGFSPTVTVAFAGAFYGQKHFAVNLPILNLVLIPASFVSTISAALPTTLSVFLLLTAFSVVGLFVNLSIKEA